MHGTTEYNKKHFCHDVLPVVKHCSAKTWQPCHIRYNYQKLRHFRCWSIPGKKGIEMTSGGFDFYHDTQEINNVKHAV